MPLAAVPILHQWEEDGQHFLLIRRSIANPQEKSYYFVFAPAGTTLQEMVQAIGARWHIEEERILNRRKTWAWITRKCAAFLGGTGIIRNAPSSQSE